MPYVTFLDKYCQAIVFDTSSDMAHISLISTTNGPNMTDIPQTTYSYTPSIRPKISRIRMVRSWLFQLWQQRNHPHIRGISSRQAHDIGLSASDQARLSHRWPSQTTLHPHG